MAKFTMDVSDATQSTGGGGGTSNVDWDALHDYTIEMAKATTAKSRKGVISGIMDLGIQESKPFEEDYTGTKDQDDRLEKGKDAEGKLLEYGAYLKEEGGKKIFVAPMRPCKQVAITIDFPMIKLNKSQFFTNNEDQEERPLRLLLNGEFYTQEHGRIVGRGYAIKEKKYDDGTWAFAKNNMIHKLAEAAGILDDKGYFTKDRLGELIGACAQFQMRIYMKPSKKDASKLYYTEEIKLNGMIPEDEETGDVILPKFDDDILYMTNFNQDNDPAWLKQIRSSVKNTMKLATNYEGSKIKAQLEGMGNGGGTSTPVQNTPQEPTKVNVQQNNTPSNNEPPLEFDDDVPFMRPFSEKYATYVV